MRLARINWRQGILVGLLVLAALWLASLIWGLGAKAEVAWREAHDTKAQYAELESRRAKLQASLDALETPRGQDAAIREAFGVAKSGEEVIVVVPPASSSATATPSFWARVWAWF